MRLFRSLPAVLFFAIMGAKAVHAIETWDVQTAHSKIESGDAILVDVREPVELKESGLARPAKSLPLSELTKKSKAYRKFVESLDKSKVVITYCRSGRRSGQFATELEKLGFKTANMGGFEDWKKAGLPTRPWDLEPSLANGN